MKASIVIATFNRPELMIQTLKGLTKQTVSRQNMEVIVADDGSVESSFAMLKAFVESNPEEPWTLIRLPVNSGKASACNAAIRQTKYPLVLFTDDDCIPDPDWVEQHLASHRDEREALSVLGSVSFPKEWIEKRNFIRYINSRYVGNRDDRKAHLCLHDLPPQYFGGLNISVPRDALFKVGLFNEQVRRGQDIELGYRLYKIGVRLVFNQKAHITHFEPESGSVRDRISKHTKVYRETLPRLNEIHPEFTRKFGHWFLESPKIGSELFRETFIKILIRLFASRLLSKCISFYLKITDGIRWLYFPLFYKYVFLVNAIENVNRRNQ